MKSSKSYSFAYVISRSITVPGMWISRQYKSANKNVVRALQYILMAVVIWAGDVIIGAGIEKLLLSSNFRFSNIYNGSGKSDIVVLGNSRGHGFYQPEIRALTGMSTINLSYNAMPVSISSAFLQDYLDIYPAPKQVLIEVSMLNKTEEEVLNSFKVYAPQSKRISSVLEERSPSVYNGMQVSSLFSYNSEVFHRSLYYLNSSDETWVVDRQMSDNLVQNAGSLKPMEYSLTEDRLADLSVIVERCKKAGAEPVLILAPMYPAYRNTIGNLNNYINRVQKATGLAVHDYSNAYAGSEYFSDYLHLNKKGSIEFMKQLKRDGILKGSAR